MKLKRFLSALLMLTVVLGALPVAAFATYNAPEISEVTGKLTDSNEGLVWDTSFDRNEAADPVGSTYNNTHFNGTVGTYQLNNANGLSASDGKLTNDADNKNLYAEGGSIVFKAWADSSKVTSDDQYNGMLVNLNDNATPRADFVISYDFTLLTDMQSGVYTQIKMGGSNTTVYYPINVTDKGGVQGVDYKTIYTLEKGVSTNITLHVKNDAASSSILYDIYINGVIIKENIVMISGVDVSTAFVNYAYIAYTGGANAPAGETANGQALYSIDSFRMYYSDECYETVHGTQPCSYSTAQYVDETGHKFTCSCGKAEDSVVAHTENAYGYCVECQADITDASVSIKEDLAINYYTTVDETLLPHNSTHWYKPVMKFTTNGSTKTVNYTRYENGKYIFSFEGIGPHQVGNKVDAELWIQELTNEGSEVTREYPVAAKASYSVEEYCKSALEAYAGDALLVELVNNLLAYAQAADVYANNKTESDIAKDLTLTNTTSTPTEADDVLDTANLGNETLNVYAAGVYFDYVNKLYFKINSATSDFAAEINGVAAEYEAIGENQYIVYSSAVNPIDFDEVVTLTLKAAADAEAVATVNYSVNTYAYHMYGEESAMGALALALYNYGLACEKFA